MRLFPVVLGSIFLAAAVVIYFDPSLISNLYPSEPSAPTSGIQYSAVLAFGLGLSGLTMLARGLMMPSAASMARSRQAVAPPAGYGGVGLGGGASPGTIYCQACGRANSTTASFCQGCGRPMPRPPPAV